MRKLLSRLLHFSIVWHLAAHGWRLLWDSQRATVSGLSLSRATNATPLRSLPVPAVPDAFCSDAMTELQLADCIVKISVGWE